MTDLTDMIAEWEALDRIEMETAKAKQDYYRIFDEIQAVADGLTEQARASGQYKTYCLVEECVDHENSEHEGQGSLAYWQAMCCSAASAAGIRAEEYGLDINALLGRTIY